jgi:hypothetical protein
MPNPDEEGRPRSTPDFEVRHSERFMRERTRSNRRGLLWGWVSQRK